MSLFSRLRRLQASQDATPLTERDRSSEDEGEPENGPADRGETLSALREKMQSLLAKSTPEAAVRLVRGADWAELPVQLEEREHGTLAIRRSVLSVHHRVGEIPLQGARDVSSRTLSRLALEESIEGCDPGRALFLDTETTGLSGGTGTVAFLIGLAFFEGDAVVLEQILLRNFGEEGPLLEHLRQRIDASSLIVTFNGKSFDLPLLRTRYVMNRACPPLERPHLDLLHVARRVHRDRLAQFRLSLLEREICRFERFEDVDSALIGSIYMQFLRTGFAEPLRKVMEHNEWDVLSMVALFALYGSIECPLRAEELPALAPEDLVGIARTLKRAGALGEAHDFASRAVQQSASGESVSSEALRVRASIAKKRKAHREAISDYELLTEHVPDERAHLELSKLYEHAEKAPERALEWALRGTGENAGLADRRVQRLARKAKRS